MDSLLKRILVNGLVTAAVLAVVGVGYAELAGLFLASKTPTRASLEAPIPEPDSLAESLESRVPMMMALWGFAFVATGEVVMHLIRKRRKAAPPVEVQPDPAEVLLEQILAKVEAERATVAETNPSPSATPAENSPVAS
jgi:hypothetical protein